LLEDLDLETGMGYLRHEVSWADSSLVHWEELLESHSLLWLFVLLVLLLVALFAKKASKDSFVHYSLILRNWDYQH
jgi:hypothetical protein